MPLFSRRDFMKLSGAATVSLALPAVQLRAASTTAADALAHQLVFDASALPGMRELFRDNTRFADFRDKLLAIDRMAERRFLQSEVRYNDQLFDIVRLGNTAENMAFLYLMTGDEDAADLAAACVRTIMRFPKWDFFLEAKKLTIGVQRAPSSTVAVALVSDWLGDRISHNERGEWLRIMCERGCEPCYLSLYGIRYPERVVGWSFDPESTFLQHRPGNYTDMTRRPEITQSTNLRAIPAAALAIGAVAARAQLGDSDDTKRWLEMTIHAIEAFEAVFKADGSYHEGLSYANYTTENLTQAITVLQRSGDADLRNIVNWVGYNDYLLHCSLPTHIDPYGIVNFGDNGNPQTGEKGRVTRSAVPYWVAKQTQSERAQWVGNHLSGGADKWSLIWHDSQLKEQAPPEGNQLWRSELDWMVARSGFGVDDLVVAMRSGGPANHEHADRNALIVKCYGEQLVTDPNRPPYSFADPAWSMRLTHAHSAVLIDGRGHQHHNGVEGTNASNAYSRIVRIKDEPEYCWWISDATQAYRLVDVEIKSVVRSVLVLYDAPVVLVADRVTKWEKPSRVQARFFGYNWDGQFQHAISKNGFTMQRPTATLHAQVQSAQPAAIRAGKLDIPEERALRHPFIEVDTESAMATTLVAALAISRSGASPAQVDMQQIGNGFAVQVRTDSKTFLCKILEDDILPVFEVG